MVVLVNCWLHQYLLEHVLLRIIAYHSTAGNHLLVQWTRLQRGNWAFCVAGTIWQWKSAFGIMPNYWYLLLLVTVTSDTIK